MKIRYFNEHEYILCAAERLNIRCIFIERLVSTVYYFTTLHLLSIWGFLNNSIVRGTGNTAYDNFYYTKDTIFFFGKQLENTDLHYEIRFLLLW